MGPAFGLLLIGVTAAPGAARHAGPITAEAIRRHVEVLGSDAMEGRAPGTRGGQRAARYLVDQLRAAGVRPLDDNGVYRQRVPLHGTTPLPASRFQMLNLGEERTLELGRDYLLATAGSQTLIPRPVPMVFVGYGIVAPEFDYNDYADVDVRGKTVVFLSGEPDSNDPSFFGGAAPTVYSRLETKQKIALARGAVGSLLIPPIGPDVDADWQRSRRTYAFENLSLAYSLPEHLCAVLHPEVAAWLLGDALYDLQSVLAMAASGTLRSFHLPVEMSFVGRFRMRDTVASNLMAVRLGADPALRDRFVVVSAHYDHLGIGPEIDGDRIYNGVVDNALGVACTVEMARQLGQSRPAPRRSVVVLLTTAEEAGLLGARTFLEHPPMPPSHMVAAVNVDGLAFLGAFNDLVAIGGGLSDLAARLEWAIKPLGLTVSRPPDAIWNHAAYARGDQLAFAEAGVPSVLVLEGFDWPGRSREDAIAAALAWMSDRYHSPRDDLEQPLDFDAAAVHCNAILSFVEQLASSPTEPEWHPGSPYAYERLLSLASDR